MLLSIICPTRNRAHLWRSGWLLDSLRAQTVPPDELVIALDHTEDDTAAAIEETLSRAQLCFPVRLLEVLVPRPGPNPASGIPDNCLFAAATGDVILHVDDDICLSPDTIKLTRDLFEELPNVALWYLMTFVDVNHHALPEGRDWRLPRIDTFHWPKVPGGLVRPTNNSGAFTGAIWSTTRSALRAIGGHDITLCGYHNTDSRLGSRLLEYCSGGSYLCTSPKLQQEHLGLTWHMQNHSFPQILRAAYKARRAGATVANGGPHYWTSPWFANAYKYLKTYPLTAEPTKLH